MKKKDGSVYLIKSVSIEFGMVDLSNPEAWEWIKSIIKNNLIAQGGAWGWMHDFGEYVPFDSAPYDGSDSFEYHNSYPERWAAVC